MQSIDRRFNSRTHGYTRKYEWYLYCLSRFQKLFLYSNSLITATYSFRNVANHILQNKTHFASTETHFCLCPWSIKVSDIPKSVCEVMYFVSVAKQDVQRKNTYGLQDKYIQFTYTSLHNLDIEGSCHHYTAYGQLWINICVKTDKCCINTRLLQSINTFGE